MNSLIGTALALLAGCSAFAQSVPCLSEVVAATRKSSFDPRVQLVSPAAGTVFLPGQRIEAVVELAPPLSRDHTVGVTLSGLTHLQAKWVGDLRFAASIALPPGIVSGPVLLTPDATDSHGNFLSGAPVVVAMKPRGSPAAVRLHMRNFYTRPDPATTQLYLKGRFASDSEADITSCLTGTSYSSSNPAVATVDANGKVTIIAAGIATITAGNGSATDFASVVVEDETNPLPPIELTSKVTIARSPLRLAPQPRLYPQGEPRLFVQDVKITNASSEVLPGPLYVVFAGLATSIPAGYEDPKLAAQRRIMVVGDPTRILRPIGSQYLSVELPGDRLSLRPGASVAFTVQFDNPDRQPIDDSFLLYRTAGHHP